MKTTRSAAGGILLGAVMLAGSGPAAGQNLTARAAVQANTVFVGEPFRLQIQVSGSENPRQPDLSRLDGFRAKFSAGGSNSRRSVTIVNGRRTENVQLGYVLRYELRATRPGRLTIPAIPVEAEGKTVFTQPLVVVAQKPSETGNYKLRLSLSRERAYVGEPLVLEATFYFRANLTDPQLTLPVTEDDAFEVHELENDEDQQTEMLEGRQFQTLRVRRVLVPRRPGQFTLEPATLAFRGQEGTEVVRDFFGRNVRRPKYKRFVIPSNPLGLAVRPLPSEGRPANFAGHVGEFSLSVQASPTEVNVGDPITLNIAVTGPPLLDPVELPPLHDQEALGRDFKVPVDIEDGEVNGNFKVFTQTIRALNDEVSAIPPLELPYFDTARGRYEVARSESIPLVVKATRILTAGDVEGLGPVLGAGKEIQSWMQGIAHNYRGGGVLSRQVIGFAGLLTPPRLAIVAGPPLVYALVFALVAASRRRHANPDATRARRALGKFQRHVPGAGTAEEILGAFRGFLGDKLARTPEALTYRDVEALLKSRGVGGETLAGIGELFTRGEAGRYAGGGEGGDVAALRDLAVRCARDLDRTLR